MKKKIKLLLLAWTFGLFGGMIFCFMRLIRRVEIFGYQKRKFDFENRGLLVVCNHPSFLDPLLLFGLFFPHYLFNLRFIPLFTPEKSNYYDKWWFILFKNICIPIDKRGFRKSVESLKKIEGALKEKRIVVLYPEGARTITCEQEGEIRLSKTGRKLGRFKLGVGRIILDTGCFVLPVWTEGGERMLPNKRFLKSITAFPRIWEKVKILIGEPLEIKNIERREIPEYLENVLLELADKISDS